MREKEQAAYDEALKRMEACLRNGSTGLDLSNLGLTHVPPEIGYLKALDSVFLQNNLLTTLPPEIGQLEALTGLYLANNQLTTLPPEIGGLKALEDLYLFNNQLTSLPKEIGQLNALKDLVLEGNDALGLPAELLQRVWTQSGDVPASPQDILAFYFSNKAQQTPTPAAPLDRYAYDVFLSVKSQDYPHARVAEAFLRKAGLRVFFCEQELPEMGNSDYFDAIDNALEGARHMLVVTSSREHVMSQWVKKEWQTYLNEKLSGRKSGNLVTLLFGKMTIGDLPLSLRQHEARNGEDLASLLNYFRARGTQ